MGDFTKHRRYPRRPGGVGACSPDTMDAANPPRFSTAAITTEASFQPHPSSTKHFIQRCMILMLVILALTADGASAFSCSGAHVCGCEINNQNQQIINCRRKDLGQVPDWNGGSSTPFHELTLAHNDIRSLGSNAFSGLNIKRLDLSENPITSIDARAFNGLEANLEELVLHVNSMNTFPKEALGILVSLRLLTVKGFVIPSLPENALQTLSQLETLKLEKCGLVDIAAQDFAPLRSSLKTLALPFNELNEPPTSALGQLEVLEHLDLQHNKLKVLSEGLSAVGAHIKTLDFSNNEITTILPNAFSGLEDSLTNLVLKSNKLTASQLLPLGSLKKLETLNLAFNSIRSIPPTSLLEMLNLRTVNLRSNNIEHLIQEPFEPVKSTLVDLELSYNDIRTIESGLFQGFTSLEQLLLDNQYFNLNDILDGATFQGLEGSLQRLNLENVGFTTANFPSISNLGNLRSLSLGDNNIRSIPDLTFQHLSQLVTLDLSNNSLTSLTQRGLHGMQGSLVEVNLVNNQIETIPSCAFNEYGLMERLKLGKNPLRCDCDLVWLRKWIAKFEGDLIKFLQIDWTCKSPSGLVDRKFRELATSDLCDRDPAEGPCETIQVSTTPTTPPSGATRSSLPDSTTGTTEQPMLINITEVTHESVLLSWRTGDSKIKQFNIETIRKGSDQRATMDLVKGTVRRYKLENLLPVSEYSTCITSQYDDPKKGSRSCTNFKTLENTGESTQSGPNIGLIVGAVIGALAFIALLIILGFFLVRYRNDGDTLLSRLKFASGSNTKKSHTPTGIPRIGYNSKRFSRPKGATASTTSSQLQNNQNQELEKKLAGFSEEERDRILNILTTTGGSTASIISTGSSTRYAPDLPPRPQSMEGYLNPQTVKDEMDDPDSHIYSEIPGAQGGYYEVPRGSYRDSGISTASGKYEPYPEPGKPPSGDCYI